MKFNFISIPRNGSQTIHGILGTNKYLNHYAWNRYENTDLPAFAFIREPLERLYSWYHFHKHKYFKNPLVNTEIYFGDFNLWAKRGFPTHWSDSACNDLGIQNPLSQYDFIKPRERQKSVELFQFERLYEGLNEIGSRFGIQIRKKHAGKSHKPVEFMESINNRSINKAKELFKKDFELHEAINSYLSVD